MSFIWKWGYYMMESGLNKEEKMAKVEMIKELGDVAWYLAETAYALDVDLETVMVRNIEKLKARYPQGFDQRRSINRDE